MATGAQVETLTGELARETPKRDRTAIKNGLVAVGGAIASLTANKATLDTVVADAATAGQPPYELLRIQADWGSQLAAVVASGFTYAGKSGLNAIAQLLKDMSVQAGLEGGANRMRLFKGAAGAETLIPVD